MTPDQYVAAVENESERFVELAFDSLDTTIGFLDDWTVRELVEHLGRVYANVAVNAVGASEGPARPGDEAQPPADGTLRDWFLTRRSDMLASITAGAASDAAWTFAGPGTRSWWARRMASETAIHRWDVDAALGSPHPIDTDAAADAVDEYIEVGLRFSASRPDRVYPAQSLHLHRTDGPGEWMLVTDDEGRVVSTHEHGKGDAAVRGPASSLLLWMWGRPVDDVEIFGDGDVAAAWRSLAP